MPRRKSLTAEQQAALIGLGPIARRRRRAPRRRPYKPRKEAPPQEGGMTFADVLANFRARPWEREET